MRPAIISRIRCELGILLLGLGSVCSGLFNEELEACINEILQRYYKATSLLLYDGRNNETFTKKSLLPPAKTIEIDDILRVVQTQNERAVDVSDRTKREILTSRYKRVKSQSSIFIFDDDQIAEFKRIDLLFKEIKEKENWNRQGKTLILVYKRNKTYDNDKMARNAIASLWKWNKAVNVVAIIAERHQFSLYIWFPYRWPHCSRVTEHPVYDIWRNGRFEHGKDLFPRKIKKNLEGCRLSICTDECLPYNFDNFTLGFEASLFHTLSDYYNFTTHKKELIDGENIWQTSYDNGSVAGAFALLDSQEVDLAYGCLMLSIDRYNLAESLPIYFHDSLTWFVPTPDRNSHAANIFEAFPEGYWLAIFITTVAALLVFVLIVKLEEVVLTSSAPQSLIGAGLRVLAMAISSPITLPSKNALLRAFSFVFAMYSLHITTIYQASLFNLYRSNTYSHVYKSLEDAVENNLYVWLRSSTKNMYNAEDGIWKKIMQVEHHGYLGRDLESSFNQVAFEKSAIILFIKSTMLVYIEDGYMDQRRQPRMLYLPEQFASYPVTLYLSPGHPMLESMSLIVHNIIASGLVSFWLNAVVRDRKEAADHLVTNVSLQLEHISGAFMFYAALISLATGVFLLEQIYWLTHGRRQVKPTLRREDLNLRRRLLFRAVVNLGRNRMITHFGRFHRH